jgi:4-amino-4-deoxy-L-arabinose transferase-like glycosyltransferase
MAERSESETSQQQSLGFHQALHRYLSRWYETLSEPHILAVLWLAFAMTCMKKWEPGGNIDTIWYAAVAKNVWRTGDFFHFYISRYYFDQILDHMPLTYWIVGGLFKLFHPTDFVARLYPIFCSFTSYIVLYNIGRIARDKNFGLVAVFMYALTLGASKWNGSLLQDIPLTLCFLACFLCTIKAFLGSSRSFYGAGFFFAVGILTKGPIIGAFPLALIIFLVLKRNQGREFAIYKNRHFFGGILFSLALLGLLFLPQLSFDGINVYSAFIKYKASYQDKAESFSRYFAYGEVIFTASFLTLPFFFWSILRLIQRKSATVLQRSTLTFALILSLCIVVPLSFFRVKFPHYMLSLYPFLALIAAESVDSYLRNTSFNLARFVRTISMLAVCIFVFLPIKITGGRSKETLNLVNLVKLDSDIEKKDVYFYGTYYDGMDMFQSFKFYADIDLHDVKPGDEMSFDLKKAYVIVPKERWPAKISGRDIKQDSDCFAFNSVYCLVTDSNAVRFHLPNLKFPHEIYSPQEL